MLSRVSGAAPPDREFDPAAVFHKYNTAMSPFLATGLLGLLAGMLVNYLSDVLPVFRKPSRPVCTHCGQVQTLRDYFIWPRRCPHCGKRRGLRTWTVEILYTGLFIWLYQDASATLFLPFWLGAVIWVYFGVVAVIDIELKLILHPVSIAGAVIGLAVGIYLHGLGSTLIGGAAGYGIMLLLYWLGAVFTRLTRRLQGDDEEVALGFGDVNLAGVLGLIGGWPNILLNLVLSVMIAGLASLAIVAVSLLLRRYKAFMAIPYGPFLVAGAAMLLFFSEPAQRLIAVIGPLFLIGPR